MIIFKEENVEKVFDKGTDGKWFGYEKRTIPCGSGALVRNKRLGEVSEKELIELIKVQ